MDEVSAGLAHFDTHARAAVVRAAAVAESLNVASVGTDHLLVGVLENLHGDIAPVVAQAGLSAADARDRLLPSACGGTASTTVGSVELARETREILSMAMHTSTLDDNRVSPGYLLLALLMRRNRHALSFFEHHDHVSALVEELYAFLVPHPRQRPRPHPHGPFGEPRYG